jgi:hypothetical protein
MLMSANGYYQDFNSSNYDFSSNIKMNSSLPIANLTNTEKDKKVYGVISDIELDGNKIVMNCFGLDYHIGSIENVSNDDGFEISNLLFWCSRHDSKYMSELSFNNEDGGNSFDYTLYNKFADNLRFVITDENYNTIDDLPEWTMILQFARADKDNNDMLIVLDTIKNYMPQIYTMIWLLLSNMNIIQKNPYYIRNMDIINRAYSSFSRGSKSIKKFANVNNAHKVFNGVNQGI